MQDQSALLDFNPRTSVRYDEVLATGVYWQDKFQSTYLREVRHEIHRNAGILHKFQSTYLREVRPR